jgi:hypothetical protein
MVGEALLEELDLVDDPALGIGEHLVGFAEQLRGFAQDRPGMATYLMRRFPRGPSGARLLEHEVMALSRRGYDDAAAVVLASSVATVALGMVAQQELRASEPAPDRDAATLAALADHPRLLAAAARLPEVDARQHFRLLMTSVVSGLVAAAPPGATIEDLWRPGDGERPPSGPRD